jgi:hypothetical protein
MKNKFLNCVCRSVVVNFWLKAEIRGRNLLKTGYNLRFAMTSWNYFIGRAKGSCIIGKSTVS